MIVVKASLFGRTHKVQERQGANVLTGCGLVIEPTATEEAQYPSCARCARKV